MFSDASKSTNIIISAAVANTIDASGMIPAIRYWIGQTIPTLTQIVEAMPDEQVLQGLNAPFMVIFAQKPSKIELAVQDQAYTVAFDLVYVAGVQAGIDNPPSLRASLRSVERALLADYQLFGRTSTPASFDLDITATPFDRMNEYNKVFARQGQSIEVAVSSIQVSYVEFNLGQ